MLEGKDTLPALENAWEAKAGLRLSPRYLGEFSFEDLQEFFGAREIVLDLKCPLKDGRLHALLPYGPLYAKLGRISPENGVSPGIPSFRPIRSNSLEDFANIARWDNDLSIRHFVCPCRDENDATQRITAEGLQQQFLNGGPFAPAAHLLIECEGRPVGTCSLILDPPHRLIKNQKIAWPSLTIGEEAMRAKGFGKAVATHLTSLARNHGAEVIEVGVFEFNEAAKALCRALGLEEIGRVERGTYWRGRYWADIRFRKILSR